MDTQNTLQIKIPDSLSPTGREMLKAMMEAMVTLRCDHSKNWNQVLSELENEGWQVSWHLNWFANARRGADSECAQGETLDETFESLRQLTHLHLVENCP